MSLFRSVLLVIIISFTAAFGLFLFGSKMEYEEFHGGYAILSADISEDESAILSLLEKSGGYSSGNIISESSQWVFLDEFDSIKKIPLNQYYSRIFSFDPRNDGYADKLKEIFINDNKRLIYMPLHAGGGNVNTQSQFSGLSGDIPFTIEYFSVERPLILFFCAYAAASLLFLIICIIKRKSVDPVTSLTALIPVFSPLAFFGAYGAACAALLFAVFFILNELIFNYSAIFSSSARKNNSRLKSVFKEFIQPYGIYWFLLLLFPAAFAVVVIFSQINILFILSVSAAALFVFLLSLKIMSASKKEHKRFAPVAIKRRQYPEFSFPVFSLPFAAAAVFILFASPYMSAAYDSDKTFSAFVTEEDYYDHINYQATFSVRQINNLSSGFPEFFYDADGLPSMSPVKNKTVNMNDYPSFPLNDLMDFFDDVNSRNKTNPAGGARKLSGKLSLLALLLIIFPVFFAKKKNVQASKIKLIRLKKQSEESAGKMRYKGINWNKKTLYNNNSLSIQKDA